MLSFPNLCTMKNIIDIPTKNDALIRVYKNECRINASAAKLLNLTPHNLLRVTVSADGCVYMSNCSKDTPCAFKPNPRGASYRVYSTILCDALAAHLDGYGTYRIDCNHTEFLQNKVFYMVDKQKY